jgi:pyruvate,orthophosphate dikinase
LFILQTRAAERSPLASTKIAVDLVTEKHITEREALQRIDPESMNCFLYPMVDLNYVAKNVQEVEQRRMSKGVTASPGVVSGSVVFTAEDVMQCKKSGQPFVFCKPDTVEDDMLMLQHAIGVLTTHGGLTSHAAVVMRGMGKTAVTGARDIIIDVHNKQLKTRDGKICLSTGDLITIDGSTGYVYRGEMPTVSSGHSQDFQTILQWADKYKNMHVLANADTAEEAKKALELGAEGIGLCRTEHMFFKEGQLQLFRKYVLSESESDKELALASLIRPFETEFMQLFRVMHGRLVAIRLLDPPAHDFFPDPSSSDFQDQIMEMAGKSGISVEHCRIRILEMQEKNPMLGCRGSRMAIMHPEIIKMQMKAMTRKCYYCLF